MLLFYFSFCLWSSIYSLSFSPSLLFLYLSRFLISLLISQSLSLLLSLLLSYSLSLFLFKYVSLSLSLSLVCAYPWSHVSLITVSLTSEQAGLTALAVAEAKGCHQVVALLKVNTPCLLRLRLLLFWNVNGFCFLRRRGACKLVPPLMILGKYGLEDAPHSCSFMRGSLFLVSLPLIPP